VSAIGGKTLTERAQRQRGNRRLQGSEGVRAVRSRSDGEGSGWGGGGSEGVRGGGVRAIRSRSDGGKLDREGRVNASDADRWDRASGARAKRYPAVRAVRSESDGGDQTGETDVREAAPLLSTVVRSPELRQARARVAPGSPELGRGEEGATANSIARKRPRIHGQRGENDGEKVSGGSEKLR
jgi:hypothetical protein